MATSMAQGMKASAGHDLTDNEQLKVKVKAAVHNLNTLTNQKPQISQKDPRSKDIIERLMKQLKDTAFLQDFYEVSTTLGDFTNLEVSMPEIQNKLLSYGDVAIKLVVWRRSVKQILISKNRDFKIWEAETRKVSTEHCLSMQSDAGVPTSKATVSDAKINDSRIILNKALYIEMTDEINYLTHLHETAKNLASVLQQTNESTRDALKIISYNVKNGI